MKLFLIFFCWKKIIFNFFCWKKLFLIIFVCWKKIIFNYFSWKKIIFNFLLNIFLNFFFRTHCSTLLSPLRVYDTFRRRYKFPWFHCIDDTFYSRPSFWEEFFRGICRFYKNRTWGKPWQGTLEKSGFWVLIKMLKRFACLSTWWRWVLYACLRGEMWISMNFEWILNEFWMNFEWICILNLNLKQIFDLLLLLKNYSFFSPILYVQEKARAPGL